MERSSAVRYTYQDLLALPERAVHRHEILDGKLFVTAAPRVNHQRVVLDLGAMMRLLAREHGLGEVVGPVTIHVHDEMVFEPDLAFVRFDRMSIVDPEGDIHGVPDLVIEVLSPSTRAYDRKLKRKHYLDVGIHEVWIIDVEARTAEVWTAGTDEPTVVDDALAWRVGDGVYVLPLAEVFCGI